VGAHLESRRLVFCVRGCRALAATFVAPRNNKGGGSASYKIYIHATAALLFLFPSLAGPQKQLYHCAEMMEPFFGAG
jgi:hypothetical protein